jgi:hypothetical protein
MENSDNLISIQLDQFGLETMIEAALYALQATEGDNKFTSMYSELNRIKNEFYPEEETVEETTVEVVNDEE